MRLRVPAIAAAVLLAPLATPAVAQRGAVAVAATPAGDPVKIVTTGGTEVTVPIGWSHRADGAVIKITSADGTYTVNAVDVAGGDAAAAFDAARAMIAPGDTRAVQLTSERAPEEGWDASFSRIYRVSPDERRTVFAFARRSGMRWIVLYVDATDAAQGINQGGWIALLESVRPAGYTPENLAGRPARSMNAARLSELRSFLETAMAELGIPGIGYAVVSRDEILFSGGLGVRALGRPEPVDADTLFMIASNTKNLTTLIFAQLVDEGRVRWNQPVTELFPSFRLGSAEATRNAQVRHLICACTGLPRRDLDWLMIADLDTPASLVFTQLANITPTSGFGAQYQYSNHLRRGGRICRRACDPPGNGDRCRL